MSNKSNRATVKKRSILLSGLFVLTMCLAGYAAADYPPNVADAIPDREFRTLCLRIADTDGDGAISREEALAVTRSAVRHIRLMGRRYRASKDCTISPTSKRWTVPVKIPPRSTYREIPVCAGSGAISIRSSRSMRAAVRRSNCSYARPVSWNVYGCRAPRH